MKAIKKIVALATGATMLGATIMGAMAADLADYPAPFVEGCSFSGAIVVGEKAAAEDVVGAVDIASALAVSGTTTATTGTGTMVTVSGEAYKIERSTNKLNLGEDVADVATKVDSGDLPVVLADGTFTNDEGKDFDYEQTIDLTSATFTAISDKDLNDNDPTIGVQYADSAGVLVYDLEFTTAAESDVITDDGLEDLEDTTIVMLGNTYDIVEATNASGGYFEIMGGATKDVMEQGEIKSFTVNDKEYEVEVTYIGGLAVSEVKMKVNGEVTKALEEGDTYKLADGTQVGIREILEEEAGEVTADQVEFYIGAEKMTLEDGGAELQLNDEDVDDITVEIDSTQTGAEYELNGITLTWTADDEFFVTEESSALMPGLESVKLSFEGLTTPAEEIIEVKVDGDDTIALKAPVKGDADGFEFAVLSDSGVGAGLDFQGEDNESQLVITPAGTADIAFDGDTDDMMVISNNDSYETHFLEVTGYDDPDGADFEDVVTGADYLKKKVGDTFEIADITFNVTAFDKALKEVTITAITNAEDFQGDAVFTPEGLKITLATVATPTFTFDEEADDTDLDRASISFDVESDVLNGTDATVDSSTIAGISDIHEIGDTDIDVYYALLVPDGSEVGTRLELDRGDTDQKTVKIFYPGGESYGNLYLAESEAGFGTAAGVSGEAVCKVSIPPAKLDSEVSSVSAQNLIVVGGPCANTVAAEVMGVASTVPECLAGFEEGKAMIKLMDTGAGKTAMLVAGYSAMDTRRATRVVANAGDYDLSGDEVEVTGTTLTDISVSAVTAE
ncbi:S-layer protein [Candidatus Woesearchaeota archaeon]|nr:S-layer protein [Candidatus Woesearchaeota archaeon]